MIIRVHHCYKFLPRVLPRSSVIRTLNHKCGLQSISSDIFNENIESTTYDNLVKKCHIKGGDTLLLSVSGGLDSMAMLHILNKIKNKFTPSLQLKVIHFNHKFRDQSEIEAKFVKSWSIKYGLEYYERYCTFMI